MSEPNRLSSLPGTLFSNGTHPAKTRATRPYSRIAGPDPQQRARHLSIQTGNSAANIVLHAVTVRAYAWPPYLRDDYLAGRLSTTLSVPDISRETALEQAAVWNAFAYLVERRLLCCEIKRDGKHVECWLRDDAQVPDA